MGGPVGRAFNCWGSFHVVTGAFAEPVGHEAGDAFTVMTTRATLKRQNRTLSWRDSHE
jgi:hypothetical protein